VTNLTSALTLATDHLVGYRNGLGDQRVCSPADPATVRNTFERPLNDRTEAAADVIADLIACAQDGLVATAGPRFFGFVVGGALPAATAAEVLAAGWDQCAFNAVLSPAAVAVEEIAGVWIKDLLGIPSSASVGFVTGAQAANTVGLAAARHQVLAEAGWDVERKGLMGAPRVRVLASAERHATIDRSLRLLGFGSDVVESARANAQGAIDVDDLEKVLAAGESGPTIVCLQAGNVNTGACDDLRAACELVHRYGGWAHVDGAFGLWAASNPGTRSMLDGVSLADSWGCDAHKWLNVPYDSAFAMCSRPEVHVAAMSYTASYLVGSGGTPGAADFTAESSRRARGFAVWAALRELGRDGVADLVERCCRLARQFADELSAAGFHIANDVVLNQVLVSFGDDAKTDRVIDVVQRGGTCWMGGTTWRGSRYMRISVSNYATNEEDVHRSVEAIREAAK
jgi:glutamate/tyrosine decarboxylase-like PLP-dependent enzyme